MAKVKLTITESRCRCGYFKAGQEFTVEDLCPPLCHELWNSIYPSVYTLLNGGSLDLARCGVIDHLTLFKQDLACFRINDTDH